MQDIEPAGRQTEAKRKRLTMAWVMALRQYNCHFQGISRATMLAKTTWRFKIQHEDSF